MPGSRGEGMAGSSLLTTSSLLSKPSSLLLSHGLSLGGGLGGLSSGDRKRKEAGLLGLGVKKAKEEDGKELPSQGTLRLGLTSSLSGSLQSSTRSSLLGGTLSTKSSLTSSLTLRSSLLSSSLTSSCLLPTHTGLSSKPAETASKPKVKKDAAVTGIQSTLKKPKSAKTVEAQSAARSRVLSERVKDVQPSQTPPSHWRQKAQWKLCHNQVGAQRCKQGDEHVTSVNATADTKNVAASSSSVSIRAEHKDNVPEPVMDSHSTSYECSQAVVCDERLSVCKEITSKNNVVEEIQVNPTKENTAESQRDTSEEDHEEILGVFPERHKQRGS